MPDITIPKPRATKNGGSMVFFRDYPTREQHVATAKTFGCRTKDCPVKPSNKGNGFMIFKPMPEETVTVTISKDDD